MSLLGAALSVLILSGTAAGSGDDWGIDGGHIDDKYDENEHSGTTLYASVDFSNSQGDSEAPRAAAPLLDGSWEPPACWYEPRTSREMQSHVHRLLRDHEAAPEQGMGPTQQQMTSHYEHGNPYERYNLEVEDDGYFWVGVTNIERADESDARICSPYGQWVEHDDSPRTDLAITPEIMAEAAYEWLPLPEVDLSFSPDAAHSQIVGLPTWVWQDAGDLEPVHATATLDRLDLEATTTAVPEELTLTSGADDLDLHPSDGTCPVDTDGSTGQPWTAEREGDTPPCGFTFHRAGDSQDLTATITWSVTWTGTGQDAPQALPDATMETHHELAVEEVQAIVR